MTVGRICGAHRAPLQKNSFKKDLSGAPTRMSILRKINFRDAGIRIEQRTHIFDHVEADIRDFSRPEPFQNLTPLERDRQITQPRDRKRRLGGRGSGGQVDVGCARELILNPVFLFGRNHRRAPDALANVSPKILLQIRDDSTANPIAERRQILV